MSLAAKPATATGPGPHAGRAGPARPADARAWLVAAVSLILAANVMFSRYMFPDSFYDLYAGRYILHHGIPHTNVVTAVAHGAPWTDQQWLAQVLFYAAWAAGGFRALAALSAVLVTSGFALLAGLMLRRGVPPARMFIWTLAAFAVCMGNTGIRAQSFGYPCFAVTLWLLLDDGQAPRLRPRTWLVIPVLLVWANTHGSVLLGAGLVAGYAGYRVAGALKRGDGRAMPAYLALAVAAVASVACTPYGIGVAGYYRRFIGNPVLGQHITEWSHPSPLDRFSWGFFALLVISGAVVVIAWRRGIRPDPLVLGIAGVLLVLAFTAVRNQAWFGFGGSLLAADTLARGGGAGPVFGTAFRRVLAAGLAGLALASAAVLAMTPDSQFDTQIPQRAIDVTAALAATHPAMRILADDSASTPLLWQHPGLFGRVAFDARIEQYTSPELTGYVDFLFTQGAHWPRLMSGYQIVVVSRPAHPGLATALARMPGWRVVYAGRDGLVLLR
ncbi:MAG TPA: hypothetical protein VIX86_06885 [Streptosporangiaceae bacterium]